MGTISEIKRFLSTSGKSDAESYFDYFDRIAKILMNNCAISKGNNRYEIVEIEFYLFTPDHQDVITYPRNCAAGQWFFHPSGVDLTFESNHEHFGGILIRSIKRIKDGQLILGPLNCVEELWNNLNAFEIIPSEYSKIISWQFNENQTLTVSIRHIPLYKKEPSKKILEWSDRLSKEGIKTTDSIECLTTLVFNHKYRFMKMESINTDEQVWKKYSAKPKT